MKDNTLIHGANSITIRVGCFGNDDDTRRSISQYESSSFVPGSVPHHGQDVAREDWNSAT